MPDVVGGGHADRLGPARGRDSERPARDHGPAVLRQRERVVAGPGERLQPARGDLHRQVAARILLADLDQRRSTGGARSPMEGEALDGVEAVVLAIAGEVAAEERDEGDRRRQRECRTRSPARQTGERYLGALALGARLGELWRELRQRARLQEQLVRSAETLFLVGREVVADELAEVRLGRHRTSSRTST